MTEADEIAATLPVLPERATMHEARAVVRRYMPDESMQVIDNVAQSLLERNQNTRFPNV